jgi:uncharacterized membrane protein YphA (DoxX/SURF4 family)
VLLPMRLYVGYWWLKLGLDKTADGWLSAEYRLPSLIKKLDPPAWFAVTFVDAANENVFLFQWLIVLSELIFGAMMLAGAVTRVAGAALCVMSVIVFIAAGFPHQGWMIPMALMALTLAIASAGRYLGLDAILRSRFVRVPLF